MGRCRAATHEAHILHSRHSAFEKRPEERAKTFESFRASDRFTGSCRGKRSAQRAHKSRVTSERRLGRLLLPPPSGTYLPRTQQRMSSASGGGVVKSSRGGDAEQASPASTQPEENEMKYRSEFFLSLLLSRARPRLPR